MNKTALLLLLTALLLLGPAALTAQGVDEAREHLRALLRADRSEVARYSGEYAYDEEYFAEQEPGTLFYPAKMEGRLPAVILTHGFNSRQKYFARMAEDLAAHGFIVFTYTALDQKRPLQWPAGLIAAYRVLLGESERPESPVYRHVDFDAVALVGHSMGGAGVLHTAMMPPPNGLGGKIKTVIGLNPYNGGPLAAKVGGGENDILGSDLSALAIPVLILTGSYDTLAYPWKTLDFYRSLRGPGKRAFLSIDRMAHADWYYLSSSPHHDVVSALVLCWLEAYLADDASRRDYFEDRPGSRFTCFVRPLLSCSTSPFVTGSKDFPAFLIAN